MTVEQGAGEPQHAHEDREPHEAHGRLGRHDAGGPAGLHGRTPRDAEEPDGRDGAEEPDGGDGTRVPVPAPPPRGAGVWAEDFGLHGPRGPVFADVTVDAPPGSLIALEGPSGSGRTCLLLALTGRMKSTEGRAEVGGHRLPKQLAAVRRISALGQVPGVTDLDPSLTVAEHLRERALLERRFTGSLRTLFRPRRERTDESRARVGAALEAAGLDLDELPKGQRTRIRDLERLEVLRLSVALALIGEPCLLAVDDLDLKLSETERSLAWELLRSLTESGTTVLAVCSEAPREALTVSTAGSSAGAVGGAVGAPENVEDAANGAAERTEASRSGARRGAGAWRASRKNRKAPRRRRAKNAEAAPAERHTEKPESGPRAAGRPCAAEGTTEGTADTTRRQNAERTVGARRATEGGDG